MHTMRVKTAGGTIAAPALPAGTTAYTSSYLHHDQLGSIVAMTNTSGAVVERLAYDPWGKRRFASGATTGNPDTLDAITSANIDRGFTMHEHIDEMGIINMNGRIYDPLIGRFMSADPYIQAPDDLQSFNRYAYVRNNPLNLTDPSGYSWWTKFRDKVLKPAIALFIDPYCGGCATLALKAYNGYHTKDVNGNKLGWKGAFFYAGLSLIPGSDNMLVNYGVNVLVGCGSSMMAGGSCKKGMLDAVTVQELGPILGGCLNARRAGGSCAVGAREAFTNQLGSQMAQNLANEAHRWNNARIERNKAEEAAAAEANEPVQIAQVSQGLRGAAGNPGMQHLGSPVCDFGPCSGGLNLRPSAQLPPMPEFDLWNILPMPVRLGVAWVLSVNGGEVKYPNNPDNSDFDRIRGTRGYADRNPEDGSVWDRDKAGHGQRDGDPSSWKRWPNVRDWEKGKEPNTIWPDGRVRK